VSAASRNAAAAVAATLSASAIATPMIVKWEGWENRAYSDSVKVATICAGSTRGVKLGDVASDAICQTKLARDVVDHGIAIISCLPGPDGLPDRSRAAFISTAYNIGVRAFCGSSMSRLAKAGDLPGACKALDLWNKAGKVVLLGLVLRRSDERALCEAGLAA
jgi:lysozyme